MCARRVRRDRNERRHVRVARLDRLGHGVVALKDQALGAILAVVRLILAPDDRKRVHDVVDVFERETVEVEEGCIELSSQKLSAPPSPLHFGGDGVGRTVMRAVTGIKPTGSPHLGNYLGVIRPALALAERAEAYYFVADLHALTSLRDRERLRRLSREVAAAWLALGLDPTVSVLYRQSDVPEVCELAWLVGCVTAKGLLNRAHAYKAAVQDNRDRELDDDAGVNAGLFTYPVLMAADILGHRADVVPVGADQRQHVEITRDVATAFNAAFRPVLHAPRVTLPINRTQRIRSERNPGRFTALR
jgi:hypothetical protein